MKIEVVVHPNCKEERVEKDLFGQLHVYVKAPPLEGKANQATLESLANFFQIKKSSIKLLSGAKSKNKLWEII